MFGKTDCLSIMEQSKLSKQVVQLKAMVHDWIPKRKATVHILRALADKLMEHHNNVQIAKVAGSSASVAGFVVAGVGFGLSFVTFGASLILTLVGVGVGAAGGITNAGSSIAEASIQKDTLTTAEKIINDDREAIQAIKKRLEELGTKAEEKIIENGVMAGFSSVSFLTKSAETGARIAGTAASEGSEALFRGLSVTSRVAHIGGFAFSAILLPFDLHTLITSSIKVDAARKGKKDKEPPNAVKELRKMACDLERNMPDENDFARELDALILNALSA